MINYTTIEINGEDVPVSVEWEMVDYGIGAYEYWGQRGVDTDVQPEITDIQPEEPNKEHDKFIDENFESLCEQLYEKLVFENDGDYWDVEPDAWD